TYPIQPRAPSSSVGACHRCARLTANRGTATLVAMLKTQNLHVVKAEPLVSPSALKRELPASDAAYEAVIRARATIRQIIAGRDQRLLAVVGPCSIHDPQAAVDDGARLTLLRPRR